MKKSLVNCQLIKTPKEILLMALKLCFFCVIWLSLLLLHLSADLKLPLNYFLHFETKSRFFKTFLCFIICEQ